jgi:hypothetical protein
MPEPSTFSINRLNNDIYPLEYSLKIKYDINVLYFTVASVEDVYKLIRDKVNAYLYIFDVSHYMEKDGIYLTLKEILEKEKIDAECIYDDLRPRGAIGNQSPINLSAKRYASAYLYEDDIIVIKKEKFRKFLRFPQYNFKMFDYDRVMSNDEFYGFYKAADDRLKNLDVFMDVKNRLPKYFISCHDNSLLYCETRDIDLKYELLKKMLHDYLETFLAKNHKRSPGISMPPQELVNELFDKWAKLTIREEGTSLKNKSIDALAFDVENNEAGTLTYNIDKKEWAMKGMRE